MTQKVAATSVSWVSILNQTGLKSWAIGKTRVCKILNLMFRIYIANTIHVAMGVATSVCNKVITVKCNTLHQSAMFLCFSLCMCRYSSSTTILSN